MTFSIECDEAKTKFGRDQHAGTIRAGSGVTMYYWHMAIEEPASEKSLNGGTVRELFVSDESGHVIDYNEGWLIKPSSELHKEVLAKLLDWAA